jgi:hypothetical protein
LYAAHYIYSLYRKIYIVVYRSEPGYLLIDFPIGATTVQQSDNESAITLKGICGDVEDHL